MIKDSLSAFLVGQMSLNFVMYQFVSLMGILAKMEIALDLILALVRLDGNQIKIYFI
jgi:hypothetical protein